MKAQKVADIKIGSKVSLDGEQWIFVGIEKLNEYGVLCRLKATSGYEVTYISNYNTEDIEIIEEPTYDTPARFKQTDYVFFLDGSHGIVLSNRDTDHHYKVYEIEQGRNNYYHENHMYKSQEELDADIKRNDVSEEHNGVEPSKEESESEVEE
jgi:hypothetical protein